MARRPVEKELWDLTSELEREFKSASCSEKKIRDLENRIKELSDKRIKGKRKSVSKKYEQKESLFDFDDELSIYKVNH